MQANDIPSRIVLPFAEAGVRDIIPVNSQVSTNPGRASLETGFPPLNFVPRIAGGIPPFGQDMNGILYGVSAWARWQAAGNPVSYNSAFSTAVGGYPRGAMLASATVAGVIWVNVVDNNTTNPDSAGAGWVSLAQAARLWVFANTGTLVVPAGVTKLKATVWGGGASGASTADGNYLGGGGGGGGYGEGLYDVTPGASIPITVGNGGANANAGQASSFGSFLTAAGGNPGWAGSSAGIGIGGTGGGVTGAQVAIPGRAGSGGIYYGVPGSTVEGGNGGGAYGGQPVRAVGTASGVVPGVPGSFPGGGGSGGSGVAGAGAGAKGLVIVGA